MLVGAVPRRSANAGAKSRLLLLLQDGCKGRWGLCLTSDGAGKNSLGSYYTDLPSNVLGSFVMGMLATSGALRLPAKQVS